MGNESLEFSGFEDVRKISTLLSREYTYNFLKLLMNYRDISASEAASRLELHIKTAQDFLEGLTELGILEKKSVKEDKRPYFRYSVLKNDLRINLDISAFSFPGLDEFKKKRIREIKESGAVFKEGKEMAIRAVTIFKGKGRSRVSNRINLTHCQGKFLFHLPFPTGEPMAVEKIIVKSGLNKECLPEIYDIVQLMIRNKVIE
ncbi:MAG: hypothetical protein KAS21_01930 [Candidatus Aminicenantes bacterium]|nr:hypothetical protein [Candidatus Aminicenantes bacterium]